MAAWVANPRLVCWQAFSILLAYLLNDLGDFCILCVTTYFINFALLYKTYGNLSAGSQPAKRTKTQ